MKFRIIRDFEEFKPQVWSQRFSCWRDVSYYSYSTVEAAKKVCAFYKNMKDNPVVEEFEL